jgi:hypothetical protein
MSLYGGIDLHANNSVVVLLNDQDQVVYQKRWLFSRDHESSEQFAWLNCSHREIETQLACSGTAPSIIVDSSQDETI